MKVEFRLNRNGDAATLLHETTLDEQLVVDFILPASIVSLPGQERFLVKNREVVVEDVPGARVGVVKLYGDFIGS